MQSVELTMPPGIFCSDNKVELRSPTYERSDTDFCGSPVFKSANDPSIRFQCVETAVRRYLESSSSLNDGIEEPSDLLIQAAVVQVVNNYVSYKIGYLPPDQDGNTRVFLTSDLWPKMEERLRKPEFWTAVERRHTKLMDKNKMTDANVSAPDAPMDDTQALLPGFFITGDRLMPKVGREVKTGAFDYDAICLSSTWGDIIVPLKKNAQGNGYQPYLSLGNAIKVLTSSSKAYNFNNMLNNRLKRNEEVSTHTVFFKGVGFNRSVVFEPSEELILTVAEMFFANGSKRKTNAEYEDVLRVKTPEAVAKYFTVISQYVDQIEGLHLSGAIAQTTLIECKPPEMDTKAVDAALDKFAAELVAMTEVSQEDLEMSGYSVEDIGSVTTIDPDEMDQILASVNDDETKETPVTTEQNTTQNKTPTAPTEEELLRMNPEERTFALLNYLADEIVSLKSSNEVKQREIDDLITRVEHLESNESKHKKEVQEKDREIKQLAHSNKHLQVKNAELKAEKEQAGLDNLEKAKGFLGKFSLPSFNGGAH